jgi:hypothetical protein
MTCFGSSATSSGLGSLPGALGDLILLALIAAVLFTNRRSTRQGT